MQTEWVMRAQPVVFYTPPSLRRRCGNTSSYLEVQVQAFSRISFNLVLFYSNIPSLLSETVGMRELGECAHCFYVLSMQAHFYCKN